MIKKRVLSLILTIVLITGIVPIEANADMGKNEFYHTFSAEKSHSAAITTDGSLYTWGNNKNGELGLEDTISRRVPTKVQSLSNVISVSVGQYNSAAITSGGTLYTWGRNGDGQLALGDKTNRDTPTAVQGISNVIAVSMGQFHSAAITSDGSLYMWGFNYAGRLGLGDDETRLVPTKVTGIPKVSAVSVGTTYSAAVTADGSLYTWGMNDEGQLGLGHYEDSWKPTKVPGLSDVVAVSLGAGSSAAITSDGALYTWGYNHNGQLGLGTRSDRVLTPTKVQDIPEVTAVSLGSTHSAAIAVDGSLYYCGGGGGNGKTGSEGDKLRKWSPENLSRLSNVIAIDVGDEDSVALTANGGLYTWGHDVATPLGAGNLGGVNAAYSHSCGEPVKERRALVKIMDGVKTPTAMMNTSETSQPTVPALQPLAPGATEADYIYDTTDPGASITFDLATLNAVTDQASAVAAVKSQAAALTVEQKQSPTGIDLMTLYAEQAISKAATKEVSGEIIVNQDNVQEIQKTAADTKAAVESTLTSAGIVPQRELSGNVAFLTKDSANVTITVESSAANTIADNVRIDTPDYSISLSKEMIAENTEDSTLVIIISENNSVAMLDGVGSAFVAAAKSKSYDVKFNKSVNENVKVSLPIPDGDNNYMSVFDEGGHAVGGKYNPTTAKMDVKVNKTGTYTVKDNKKDFSDIQNKSKEMQEAIRVLSAKGIINGTSETAFSPDSPITRAQIAILITKTLSKLDANANGGFGDVKSSDWFYGAAGSAKNHGIMSGTSATTFAPNVNIPKDQIVAVSARVLRNEMKYKNPSSVESMLSKYSDKGLIPDWAKTDVALATQLNLVVYRTDGNFSPSGTMTRGDAAVILYRMFMKIW